MKKKKPIKRRESDIINLALVLSIIILCFSIVFNIYSIYNAGNVLEIREINASLIVSDNLGFDLTENEVNFGEMMPGNSASRNVLIENTYDFPIIAEVYAKGEISKFISGNRKEIGKGERAKIFISAFVPEKTEYGRYEGRIIVVIKQESHLRKVFKECMRR